jgi:AcrR family transcriptional regulator
VATHFNRPEVTVSPRADAVRNRARILDAAARVFAADGAAASTERVAAEAGVAVGTVFRHFPTKADLLRAIMKDLAGQLAAELSSPEADLFSFFTRLVRESADKRTVIELLTTVDLDMQIRQLAGGVGVLLARAQAAGEIRGDVRVDEVIALLTATCQGALHGGWNADLRERTLAVVFAGLRPPGSPLGDRA